MSKLLPMEIFKNKYCFTTFRITDNLALAVFEAENKLIRVSMEGTYNVAELKTDGSGECLKTDEIILKV